MSVALLVSLAAHLAILGGGVALVNMKPEQRPSLRAALQSRPVAEPRVLPQQPSSPASAAAKLGRPQLATRAAAVAEIVPSEPVGDPVAVAGPAIPATTDRTSEGNASGPPNYEAPSDGLREYRLALAREARRFRRYPPMARERGWTGVVEVHLTLSAQLPMPVVSLGRSSGNDVLDRQALETISQAVRAAAIPEGLRGRDWRLAIPVEFSLGD